MNCTKNIENIQYCGECAYWTPTGSLGGDTPLDLEPLGACPWYNAARKESDFCSSGKPKKMGQPNPEAPGAEEYFTKGYPKFDVCS